MPHGAAWTLKELFVYPNEYVYWSIQIVMYPFMTGLVAGAFVLSSLHHVFGIRELRGIARFSLVFSFALLLAAPLPLIFHLQQPMRAANVFLTPHFTSAIAAFGIIFTFYGAIVASELWFLFRSHFVTVANRLRAKPDRSVLEWLQYLFYSVLTLGAWDISPEARRTDHKAIRWLAALGIPVACFLHGYAGFIFGSVKANALWMTPLMPVIFIMSAIVSGIALSTLTYLAVLRIHHRRIRRVALETSEARTGPPEAAFTGRNGGSHALAPSPDDAAAVRMAVRYLLAFMASAISLELLDLVFRSYTAVRSWDALRSVIYGKDFTNIFVLQYGLGGLLPFVLLLLPRLTTRRLVASLMLVLLGVFMMRWNVVIGGQAFSLTFDGYTHYQLPIIPHDRETYAEGLFGALTVAILPFLFFALFSRILPVLQLPTDEEATSSPAPIEAPVTAPAAGASAG